MYVSDLIIGVVFLSMLIDSTEGYERVDVRKRIDEGRASRHWSHDHYIRKRSIEIEEDEEINERDLLLLEPDEDLEPVTSEPSSVGVQVRKYQETYKNVPVFDGIVTVETTHDGKLTGDASGTLIQKLSEDIHDVRPALNKDQILKIAIEKEGDVHLENEVHDANIELWIFPDENNKARLVYFVQYLIEANVTKRPSMILDASTGKTILRYDALGKISPASDRKNTPSHPTCSSDSITGVGGNTKIGKIEYGKEPYCVQPLRYCYLENSYVRVVDMMNSRTVTDKTQDPVGFYCDEYPDDEEKGAYSPSLDAYFYGTVVSKMYSEWVGGSPIEDKIVLRVHYGTNIEDAYWDGKSAKFGDGRNAYYPLVSLDIVGHEIGHAVVGRHSKLLLIRQPGAIHEAFADIMGETAVAYLSADEPKLDWKIGAEIGKKVPFLRSFKTPEVDGKSVSHVNKFTDYLDPHHSSGIFRLAFYTIVNNHNVSIKNAFRVFDHANKLYWHHMSTLQDAGCQVIKAAYDLGQNINAYTQAFDVVGVNSCNLETHIRSLVYLKRYTDILVSNESTPFFKFTTHPFTLEVVVRAESKESDIEIYLYNSSTATEPFDSDENQIQFSYDGGATVYILLATSDNTIQNVTLSVPGVICNRSWQSPLKNGTVGYRYEICKYSESCRVNVPFCSKG